MLLTSRFRNAYKRADPKSEEMILLAYEGIILKIILRKQKMTNYIQSGSG